jgi:hypothetical protein
MGCLVRWLHSSGTVTHARAVNAVEDSCLGRCYFTGRLSGVRDWPVLGVHRGSNDDVECSIEMTVGAKPILRRGHGPAEISAPQEIALIVACWDVEFLRWPDLIVTGALGVKACGGSLRPAF